MTRSNLSKIYDDYEEAFKKLNAKIEQINKFQTNHEQHVQFKTSKKRPEGRGERKKRRVESRSTPSSALGLSSISTLGNQRDKSGGPKKNGGGSHVGLVYGQSRVLEQNKKYWEKYLVVNNRRRGGQNDRKTDGQKNRKVDGQKV